jgi:hypothetical protein
VISLVLALAAMPAADPVDSLVENELKAKGIPGLNVLVTQNDR